MEELSALEKGGDERGRMRLSDTLCLLALDRQVDTTMNVRLPSRALSDNVFELGASLLWRTSAITDNVL